MKQLASFLANRRDAHYLRHSSAQIWNDGSWKKEMRGRFGSRVALLDELHLFLAARKAAQQTNDDTFARDALFYGWDMYATQYRARDGELFGAFHDEPEVVDALDELGGKEFLAQEILDLIKANRTMLAPELSALIERRYSDFTELTGSYRSYNPESELETAIIDFLLASEDPLFFEAFLAREFLREDGRFSGSLVTRQDPTMTYLRAVARRDPVQITDLVAASDARMMKWHDTTFRERDPAFGPHAVTRYQKWEHVVYESALAYALLDEVEPEQVAVRACANYRNAPNELVAARFVLLLDHRKTDCLEAEIETALSVKFVNDRRIDGWLNGYKPTFDQLHEWSLVTTGGTNPNFDHKLGKYAALHYEEEVRSFYASVLCGRHYQLAYDRLRAVRAIDVMVDELASCNSTALATLYLRSNDEALRQAARDWARRHGYTTVDERLCGGAFVNCVN